MLPLPYPLLLFRSVHRTNKSLLLPVKITLVIAELKKKKQIIFRDFWINDSASIFLRLVNHKRWGGRRGVHRIPYVLFHHHNPLGSFVWSRKARNDIDLTVKQIYLKKLSFCARAVYVANVFSFLISSRWSSSGNVEHAGVVWICII